MTFCKLLSVLVLIHYAGDVLGAEVESSIIGGRDAQKGSWPWMVPLTIRGEKKSWRCGGTILNNQWVLSAAHCWKTQPEPNLHRSMLWVGAYDLENGGVRYMGIIRVITHPRYRAVGGGYVNDVALVQLKKKLTFSDKVQPVVLPSVDDVVSSASECWITGWGYTGSNVPLPAPEVLQELKIPIVPESVCKTAYPGLTSDLLCAGDMAGGEGACQGDYGGPLMCRTPAGMAQVGIMSYGSSDGCGLPGRPGVYTRVSKYLSFINDYINRTPL